MKDMDASYRNEIREVNDRLITVAKVWRKRFETLDEKIAVSLSRHSQLEQDFAQYYGVELTKDDVFHDESVCKCVNRENCDFPELNLNIVDENSINTLDLREDCKFDYESVWFTFLRLQWKEVPKELRVDDKLKEWLQLISKEGLKEKIEAYEVARRKWNIFRRNSRKQENSLCLILQNWIFLDTLIPLGRRCGPSAI